MRTVLTPRPHNFIHPNVVVDTSLEFDTAAINVAILFLMACLKKHFIYENDDLSFHVITETGSNYRVSVIPHCHFKGANAESRTACEETMLSALSDASNSVFGTGPVCMAKSDAFDAVKSDWNVPEHVGWDSVCALSHPMAPNLRNPSTYLIAGFCTALVAPKLVFSEDLR